MLDPDPQRLQAQPGERGVVADIAGRQGRVDQMGGGEQCGVGDFWSGQLVGGVGVVQPSVEMLELAIELGGAPLGGRDIDAKLMQ